MHAGETRVYIRQNNSLTQILDTIYGVNENDYWGWQAFLNTDGSILALGTGIFNGQDLHPMKLYRMNHSYDYSYTQETISTGGGGGFTNGTLRVIPGTNVTILVGQAGKVGRALEAGFNTYGGGGKVGNAHYYAGQGGGRSALRIYDDEVATAGGMFTLFLFSGVCVFVSPSLTLSHVHIRKKNISHKQVVAAAVVDTVVDTVEVVVESTDAVLVVPVVVLDLRKASVVFNKEISIRVRT